MRLRPYRKLTRHVKGSEHCLSDVMGLLVAISRYHKRATVNLLKGCRFNDEDVGKRRPFGRGFDTPACSSVVDESNSLQRVGKATNLPRPASVARCIYVGHYSSVGMMIERSAIISLLLKSLLCGTHGVSRVFRDICSELEQVRHHPSQ